MTITMKRGWFAFWIIFVGMLGYWKGCVAGRQQARWDQQIREHEQRRGP